MFSFHHDIMRALWVSIIVNYYLLAFKFNEYLNSNSFYSQRFSQVHEFSQVQVVSRTLWRASKTGLILEQTVRERTFQKKITEYLNWNVTGRLQGAIYGLKSRIILDLCQFVVEYWQLKDYAAYAIWYVKLNSSKLHFSWFRWVKICLMFDLWHILCMVTVYFSSVDDIVS